MSDEPQPLNGGPRDPAEVLKNYPEMGIIREITQPPSAVENEEIDRHRDHGIHEMRIEVGDAEISIPPVRPRSTIPGVGGEAVATATTPEQPLAPIAPQKPEVIATVAAPTPIGQAKIEVEQGDTIGSVFLILALTTGLLIQAVVAIWAYFYFKGKYAKQ